MARLVLMSPTSAVSIEWRRALDSFPAQHTSSSDQEKGTCLPMTIVDSHVVTLVRLSALRRRMKACFETSPMPSARRATYNFKAMVRETQLFSVGAQSETSPACAHVNAPGFIGPTCHAIAALPYRMQPAGRKAVNGAGVARTHEGVVRTQNALSPARGQRCACGSRDAEN